MTTLLPDASSVVASGAAEVAAATDRALRGNEPKRPDKLPVRDRIALLVDPDSFVEDGLLATAGELDLPADGVVTGVGRIEGRRVAVIASDFTVKAGSWGELTCEKQVRLSGRVPQICVLLGPSAAGGAYMPAFCDWVGMVAGNASMYLASPRVAEKVTGEITTLEEMGGALMHAGVSGCADEVFDTDWEAISAARLLLSYLPDDFRAAPAAREAAGPERDDLAELIPVDPNAAYDVRDVVECIVDAGSFFEIKARWAQEMVVGLARLDGRVVGIVANQPSVRSGAIFVDSADKAARFISMCDAYNIPLVFLQDVPGFMVGVVVERAGIIRHGAKMVAAMSSAEVPKISVVLRKAYAAGFYAMCAPGFEPRATLALPTSTIGPMSAEASVNAVYANKIAAITDEAERAEFVAARILEQQADINLLRMGANLAVDAVVVPQRLRAELIARLADADGWSREPGRRHHLISPV